MMKSGLNLSNKSFSTGWKLRIETLNSFMAVRSVLKKYRNKIPVLTIPKIKRSGKKSDGREIILTFESKILLNKRKSKATTMRMFVT